MLRHLPYGAPFVCIASLSCQTDEHTTSSERTPIENEPASFVAMTFNVKWNDSISNSYAERAGCIAEQVVAERPDILVIQEIRPDMAPEAIFWSALSSAARSSGQRYGRFAGEMSAELCRPTDDCKALDCPPEASCGEVDLTREQLPIYWNRDRFELIDGGVHKIDGETSPYTRSLSWVELADSTTGRVVTAYNVHVDHFKEGQARQIARIAEVIAHNDHHQGPLLVLGDFNVDSTTKEGREKLTPISETLDLEPANRPGVGTLHGFDGKAKAGAIDYLFYSDALTADSAAVHQAPSQSCPQSVDNCADHRALGRLCEEPKRFVTNGYPSDHYAVSARFRVR